MNNIEHIYGLLTRDAGRLGGLPLWLALRALPMLVAAFLVLLLLSPAPGRATVAAEEALLDGLASGHMLLQSGSDGRYTPALMQASKVHIEVSGMIATVSLEQSFRNDSSLSLEGLYVFPLPDTAAVRYLEMTVGGRRIVGKIRERAAAKKLYAQAKASGRRASLVEQQRPNIFTNRVANIGAGETVTVRLEYVQNVAFANGEFSLRLPTTLTPRYTPGGAHEEALSPPQFPGEGDERAPLNPLEVSVRLDMGVPLARVEAPYHDITLARRAGVYSICLSNGVTAMDRDFVLTWQPVSGSTPTATLFTEKVDGQYYGLLMVLPPAVERAGPVPPREVIFVVDTSGSMGGSSIAQARDSVSRALLELRPEDRFNIIEFNSVYRTLYRRSLHATRHHVAQAREFVRLLHATGGTEMLPALRAALEQAPAQETSAEPPLLRQVIFITDGAVGNELALFEEISARLGTSRLFTVGIGSAPNSWFMREAARFGRGSHTHIGSLDEVGSKMAALFAQLAQPAATNLSLSWPVPVEVWPERLPDLYLGQPLLVAVSFGANAPQGEVSVGGDVGGKPWRQTLQMAGGADPVSAARHQGVASLWARQKIAGLLDQLVLGRSEEAVRAQVLPIALQHQLLSPYTSFIAVEEVVSLPPGERAIPVAIANTQPQGQTPQTFAFPRTATTGPAKAWFGILLLFAALLVRVLRQPEVDHVPVKER